MSEVYEFIGIQNAATYLKVSRSEMSKQVRSNKVKALKKLICIPGSSTVYRHQYLFKKSDLDDYLKNKFDRRKLTPDENDIYDRSLDQWAPSQIAKILSELSGSHFPAWRVLYWIKTGKLKAKKKGRLWVVSKDEAIQTFIHENKQVKQMTR